MIVHPDFLDHRKTKKLVKAIGEETAPFILLRLWGYCQRQRKSVFETVPDLSGICHSDVPTDRLLEILIDCGWVEKLGGGISIHDWEKCNRVMLNSWENGKKGGHPSKFKPTGYPRDTHRQPVGSANRSGTDKHKVGYPRADALCAHDQSTDVVLSEEEKAANHKKIAEAFAKTAEALRSSDHQPESTP